MAYFSTLQSHSGTNVPDQADAPRGGRNIGVVNPASRHPGGLCEYGFRYYHPELGRWASRDPIGEMGGPVLYAFGFNSPPSWFDYLGREPRTQTHSLQMTFEVENGLGAKCYYTISKQDLEACARQCGLKTAGDIISSMGDLNSCYMRCLGDIAVEHCRQEFIRAWNEEVTPKVETIVALYLLSRLVPPVPGEGEAPANKGCKPCNPPKGSTLCEVVAPGSRERGAHKKGGGRDCGHCKIWTVLQQPAPDCGCFWSKPTTIENCTDCPPGSQPGGPPTSSRVPGGGPIE